MDRDFDEWLTGIRRYRDHGQTVFGRQGPRVDAIPNLFDACDRTLFEEREDQVGRERGSAGESDHGDRVHGQDRAV